VKGEYRFTRGDADESLSIMREAAEWLCEKGAPMWRPEELSRAAIQNPAEEFIVMYDREGNSVATLLLSFSDPFFFPDVPAGTSGFIHKLAVRRKYAGQGLARKLIFHAASLCKEKGVGSIRLDCDAHRPSLRAFYENAGFALLEEKSFVTPRLGTVDCALYRLDF